MGVEEDDEVEKEDWQTDGDEVMSMRDDWEGRVMRRRRSGRCLRMSKGGRIRMGNMITTTLRCGWPPGRGVDDICKKSKQR